MTKQILVKWLFKSEVIENIKAVAISKSYAKVTNIPIATQNVSYNDIIKFTIDESGEYVYHSVVARGSWKFYINFEDQENLPIEEIKNIVEFHKANIEFGECGSAVIAFPIGTTKNEARNIVVNLPPKIGSMLNYKKRMNSQKRNLS